MFNRINIFLIFGFVLAGCNGMQPQRDWFREYGDLPASSAPAEMAPGFYNLEYGEMEGGPATPSMRPTFDNSVSTVSVLLPMSGTNAALGTGIKHAIEIAFLQKQPQNIIVTFNDISGDLATRTEKIRNVVERRPSMIIGPIFSEDVAILRRLKDPEMPALTFTSSHDVLGDGVFTVALLPHQSVESIIQSASNNDVNRITILAPDTRAGHMLAAAALEAAGFNNIRVVGLHYYKENDMESQKSVAERAAMWRPRERASTRAKEILSDALQNQTLSESEHENLDAQLTRLNRSDTLGQLPFDAVLFLGNAADSKSLASFLRYFDVPAAGVRFLGTAMWDTELLWRDVTFSGAEYSALPPTSQDFVRVYSDLHGRAPNRMNSMGYDAAMLAIGALSGNRSVAAHLLDPSGYSGLDGLVRLRPNGTNERALQIMRLNASGAPRLRTPAARNFIVPLYQTRIPGNNRPREIEPSDGFNPMDYIALPPRLLGQYRAQIFRMSGAHNVDAPTSIAEVITIMPEDDSDEIIAAAPEFQPVPLDTIDRQLVDSVTVTQ